MNSTAHHLNRKRLLHVLSEVRIVKDDRLGNCVVWVKHALEVLQVVGRVVATAVFDWNVERDRSQAYHHEKMARALEGDGYGQ